MNPDAVVILFEIGALTVGIVILTVGCMVIDHYWYGDEGDEE